MINTLIKYRLVFIIIIIGLLIFSLGKVSSIKINTDVSQFFPTDDPDYTFYENVNTKLQKDEYLVLVGIQNKDSTFSNALLNNIRSLSNTIKNLEYVKQVTGVHNSKYIEKTLFGSMELPYVDYSDINNIKFNKVRALKNFDTTQNFMSKNLEALFIWVEIEDIINNEQLDSVMRAIEVIKKDYKEIAIYTWGRKYIDKSFEKILIQEIGKLGLWIFIFMCIALLLIFKNPLALVLPLILITSVIILFVGGMVMFDRPLGTMSNLFPTIILIVGISDIIHMCIKFNMETSINQKSVHEATVLTLKEIGWTTFITSFTTALGFFILIISPMKAMRDFGMESAIVVLLTYVLTILLVPTFFNLFKTKNVFAVRAIYHIIWEFLLEKIDRLKLKPKKVILFYFVLIVISLFGMRTINTNTHQYSIPENSELFTDYQFFETNFGGSRTFELVLTSEQGHQLNNVELLKLSNTIHDYLSKDKKVNTLKSPITYYRAALGYLGLDDDSSFASILNERNVKKAEKEFLSKANNTFLFDTDRTVFKFSGQINDIGRDDIKSFNQEVMKDLELIIGTAPVNARISGLDHLIDRAHHLSIQKMVVGLIMIIMVVALILGLIFRSLSLTVLTLILNIIPLIISAGILGFTNLELRGEITLIFTVGFVIAIDDTIHLLSKFQFERKKGADIKEAIDKALIESGKAILATSIILIGGFFVLLISNSYEIFTLGLIVGIMCIVTLTVDLVLAPILILNWFKKYI
ncbi:efflux RND transporter permease subunit [Seonamhaeicola maritimus]|uniref:MMPL family transporter n=1 Tax=Seonamhaeicola maritimus TaxID=2591822 RepID=A0A5C7GKM3_9FLAO|nr:MMPL family transporter [Seonamhaeicola maritimus]TXG38667.1 MMPL family transporter [Seonamhaeicola maritimus]